MHSFIFGLITALRSPLCRKALVIIIAFVSAFGLLQASLFFESPFVCAAGGSEVIGYSAAYYQGACPVNSETAAGGTFELRPLSVDGNYFYHIVPTDSGKTLTDPYTVTKGDCRTFAVVTSRTITGLGTAETASIGSDLQGANLYLTVNDKTAVISKADLSSNLYNFAFGQTNIVQGIYIYSLKPDGVYKINTQTKQAAKLYTLEIIVDKESTARMYEGCARFLIRRDGVLKIAVFDPEAEAEGTGTPLRYIELEDQSDCDCTAEGTVNYLIGISPSGRVVSASRTSAKKAYVRSWDAEGHKLASVSFDLYSGFSSISGVFPVYSHEKEIDHVYTTSYSAGRVGNITYHYVSMTLYHLADNPAPVTVTSAMPFLSNMFDRPLYAVYTNDGSVIAARGCIWKNANNNAKSLEITINREPGAASSPGTTDLIRQHLEYSYTNDYGIWVMTSSKAEGQFNLFRLGYEFEFTDKSARPEDPLGGNGNNGGDEGEEGNGGGQNVGNGGEGGNGEGQQDPEGGAGISAARWRLHRAY